MLSKFEKFLQQYGIRHRQSSAYYAHSNSRAEVGVKSGKRLLRDNVDPDGRVNNDKFLRALLQYRNTPQPDTRLSPAQVVYGRYMKDFIPVVNDKYEPKQEWALVREYRERALARRLDRDGARLEQYTKKQKQIPIGGSVAVQNQTGRFPKKWDKTGVVLENMDHDKVLVRMDGSRRLTTRNRRFVRQILSPPDLPNLDVPSANVQRHSSSPVVDSVDEVPTAQSITKTSNNVCHLVNMEQHQSGADNGIIDYVDNDDRDQDNMEGQMQPQSQLPELSGSVLQPTVGRPQREKRPNVRYSAEEYDLATVSASRAGLILSGLYVKQGRLKNRGRC